VREAISPRDSGFPATLVLRVSKPPVTHEERKKICMAQRSATIKVLCRTEALQNAAKMLQWALGHRVSIEEDESSPNSKVGCLFVFTDIEYYNNDTTLFEKFGFDMIGKISGVVSWEVLEHEQAKTAMLSSEGQVDDQKDAQAEGQEEGPKDDQAERERLEVELMQKLCVLPITISIMPRMEGKFAWKCLEASGYADSFADAMEASLTHLTKVFKLIRSELLA
jgi:hypothetical protein